MTELWDVLDENGNKTGRLHERGKPMLTGEFHLVVHVWIMNHKGEFLISKRTPNKSFPGQWEMTGGCAIVGDDSLSAALREVREEIGVTLLPENGRSLMRLQRPHSEDPGWYYMDVWLFRQDVDLSSVVLQPGETCDAMWADKSTINRMMDEGTFIGQDIFSYIEDLFAVCEECI